MKEYEVITMDNGKKERHYFTTEGRARSYMNRCGSAVIYKYSYSTCCYDELIDAQ